MLKPSITDVLDQLGVPYKRHGEGGGNTRNFLAVNCPFCGRDPYMGISLNGRVATCWQCGIRRVGDTLAELSGWSIGEVLGLLKWVVDANYATPSMRTGRLVLPKGLGPLLGVHRKYLRSRGLNPDEMVRLWGLQGIGEASDLKWRVFIPVAHNGETVSWTTRHVNPDQYSRYISASPEQEKLPHKNLLLGADFARLVTIVVESPFSVFRIGPGVTATLGVGTTPAQLAALASFSARYVAFDADPEAQRRAATLCAALGPFGGKTHRIEVDAPQPDQASDKEVVCLRRLLH